MIAGRSSVRVHFNAQNYAFDPQPAIRMETGKIVLEGEGKALLRDSNVKKAYLGK